VTLRILGKGVIQTRSLINFVTQDTTRTFI
jgi:hypothetical protein